MSFAGGPVDFCNTFLRSRETHVVTRTSKLVCFFHMRFWRRCMPSIPESCSMLSYVARLRHSGQAKHFTFSAIAPSCARPRTTRDIGARNIINSLQKMSGDWRFDQMAAIVASCGMIFPKSCFLSEVFAAQTTAGLRAVPLRIYGDGADVFGHLWGIQTIVYKTYSR